MSATIKDVAKHSGYSVTTVSYALNGNKEIPEKTREKIEKSASELNYVPSAYASGLKRKKTFNIGVFISDFDGPIHHTVLSGMAKGFSEYDKRYNMLVSVSDKKIKTVREKFYDLAIIYDSKLNVKLIEELASFVPIIVLDKVVEGDNIYSVDVNNESGMYEQATNLIKKGCKRIGYLYGPHESNHNKARFLGYKRALEENGLFDEKLFYDADSFTESIGYLTIKEAILNNQIDIDGLMCGNDELAIGAMKALIEAGFNLPHDIKITGFDNIDKCEFVIPTLSTISVDWFQYGKSVAEHAISILNNKEKDKQYILNIAHVIERNSTQ